MCGSRSTKLRLTSEPISRRRKRPRSEDVSTFANCGQALEDIADFIGRESKDFERGATYVARLRARCEKRATLPGEIGRPRLDLGPDVRSFIDGNYVIIFRCGDTFIDILNVVHARRDRQPPS